MAALQNLGDGERGELIAHPSPEHCHNLVTARLRVLASRVGIQVGLPYY